MAITDFRNDYFFLSNFYMYPITYEGIEYPSSEHAFQAAKTLDVEVRKQIAALVKASESKAAGKGKVPGINVVLRADWEKPGSMLGLPVKYDIMKDIVRIKFKPFTALADRLLLTGDEELIEGNYWHDHIWGTGTNYLGKILMEIREELKIAYYK